MVKLKTIDENVEHYLVGVKKLIDEILNNYPDRDYMAVRKARQKMLSARSKISCALKKAGEIQRIGKIRKCNGRNK